MKVLLATFAAWVYLQAAACVMLSLDHTGVPESARVWSITQYLLRGDKESILQSIYPMIFQLDDEMEQDLNDDICSAVASRISELGEPHLASLIPFYCRWYPMGIPAFYCAAQADEYYFVLNGKRYKNPDDMYYLESGELNKQAQVSDSAMVLPGEAVIGCNTKAPIVHFYGCPDEEGLFEEFNRNLYSEATQTGKLRFIWRPTCSLKDTYLGPFPVGMTMKDKSFVENLPNEVLNVPDSFDKSKFAIQIPSDKELSDLDLKVANLIAENYQYNLSFDFALKFAKDLVNNFPIVVPELISMPNDTELITESNEKLAKSGVDYKLLGLYLNGQNWKVSSLNEYTLINALKAEYYKLKQLSSCLSQINDDVSLVTAKRLITYFAQISLPNLQQLQPVKLDLHRIRGFSESVIYFNDIEIDDQYRDLTRDIEKFFEKSKFGEIPEYRHNWSELIFVIDFNHLDDPDTKLALEGLKRAISVITQGYPQRIGLLPLNTGDAGNIIKKIYELKNEDLLLLEDFLGDELIRGGKIFCDYPNTPNVANLLKNLQINETSIIINGEIYPFKKNTWHYLVAKTIKKDTAFLKRELGKYVKHNEGGAQPVIDVRDILHLKSSAFRHLKYTPDYFADATYTTLDNTVLESWHDRIFDYIKGEKYNILHTVTIVDDFNSLQALKRLHNLINVKFLGIKFRAIHTGLLSSNWKTLKGVSARPSFVEDLKLMIKKSSRTVPKRQLEDVLLQTWLPDLNPIFFSTQSFMLINGRFLHFEIDEIPQTKLFEATIRREAQRTLDALEALEMLYPRFSEGKIDAQVIESAAAILTKMFYQGTNLYNNGPDYSTETSLSRMDLTKILEINNFTIFQSINYEDRPIDLVLIVDPLEERSQKLLSLIDEFKNLPFVNVKLVLFPTVDLKIMPINRIYAQDLQNKLSDELPKLTAAFDVEIEAPSNLVLTSDNSVSGYLIEVHSFDKVDSVSEGVVDGIGGVCLELINAEEEVVDCTITMKTFGYGQFIAPQLGYNYTVKSCNPKYEVVSFSTDARADYIPVDSIDLSNTNPVKVYVKLEEVEDPPQLTEELDVINIFTVLKNDISMEENYKTMVLSILFSPQRNIREVKFWLLDQPFITSSLRVFALAINNDPLLGGTIEFVRYEWPSWLRPQRYLARRMDALKILFLDVLFPQEVTKVFYMDPINSELPDPFKLNEKVTTKSPFAMFKMVGHGYWELGYWAKRIGDHNLKFHSIEPVFVVNLKKLREIDGGNKLRIHYQRLSANANSLAKIDQDLVNDVQEEVPIRTLSRSTVKYLKTDKQKIDNWLKRHTKRLEAPDYHEIQDDTDTMLHDEL